MAKIGFIEVDITADISHIRAGLASASSLIRDFSLLSMGLTSGINNAFRKISTIGIRAFQIGLVGITGTLVGATMEGSKFEDAMKRVFIMVGKGSMVAAGDMAMLTARAEELGRETLFSATEAAEGMVILGRAGFDVGQIFTAVGPILELAIATNMDMATTADMVVSSLYGFGKAASDAGHMADVMATIVTGSNETMLDLSNTLSYIAPIASSVGLTVEETGAAIMMLSNAGVRGSKAATGLRAAIAKMLSPTQAEKKLLDKLGVSFLTAAGELKNFGDIIGELGKSTISTANIFQLFGRRAATAISVLRRMGPSTFREFTSDLKRSEGATERMAEQMRKTFIGRVRDLVASIKLLGTTIYKSYSEPLTDATFSLRNLVVAITKAIKGNRTFESIVKGILGLVEKYGISFDAMRDGVISFIESLTPEKIAKFFGVLVERIEKARETVGEFLAIAVKGIAETLPDAMKVATETLKLFNNWWVKLSNTQKEFIGKVTGITGALLWLVGGLTPIILLFITLSSIISALVHIHIAAAITGSLVYAKALSVLKIAAIGVGWALGIVGAAIAGWKIGEWIGNLKLFSDEITTVNDIVTDWFTNMIVGWRVFIANIRMGALEVARIFSDYLVKPLNALQKIMTLGIAPDIKPFEGLAEAIREASIELESARANWQETGRQLERQARERRVGPAAPTMPGAVGPAEAPEAITRYLEEQRRYGADVESLIGSLVTITTDGRTRIIEITRSMIENIAIQDREIEDIRDRINRERNTRQIQSEQETILTKTESD